MKKKIGTVMEADVLVEAKERAAREGRAWRTSSRMR